MRKLILVTLITVLLPTLVVARDILWTIKFEATRNGKVTTEPVNFTVTADYNDQHGGLATTTISGPSSIAVQYTTSKKYLSIRATAYAPQGVVVHAVLIKGDKNGTVCDEVTNQTGSVSVYGNNCDQ